MSLLYSADKLRLLKPGVKTFLQKSFDRDSHNLRPSNLDHIVGKVYEDLERISNQLAPDYFWTAMGDTPNSFSGATESFVGVNTAETALEYKTLKYDNATETLYGTGETLNLGTNAKGILKLQFSTVGNIDYKADLPILSGGIEKARFKQTSGFLGLGTTAPTEYLHSSGGIRVGTATNTNSGTFQWNGTNFQGHNGSGWVNLDITDHTLLSNIGTNTHAQIDTHIANTANPHGVTAAQVGNTTAQWNADRIEGNLTNIGTLGAGQDGQALVWDNATSRFITSTVSSPSLYTGSGIVPSSVVASLTDTLTFTGNGSLVDIINTATASTSGNEVLRISSDYTNTDGVGGYIEFSNKTGTANIIRIKAHVYGTWTNAGPRLYSYDGANNIGDSFLAADRYGALIGKNVVSRVGTETISLQGSTLVNDKFEIQSTTAGFLMPRMTTAQMNAIATPDTHLLIFNTDLNGIYRYDGSAWVALSTGYGIISVNDAAGAPTFYADLGAAITAVVNGTVTLHSDITVTSTITMPTATTELTLVGNGHTITHTSNSGSEFSLFYSGSGADMFMHLSNIKILSNGTGTGNSTGAIFHTNVSGKKFKKIYADNATYVHSVNNSIAYFGGIYGGVWECDNNTAGFAAGFTNAHVTTLTTRGTFTNCIIKLNTGGSFDGTKGSLFNCDITGDATVGEMITTSTSNRIWNCDITCTSGANYAVYCVSSTWNGEPNMKDCNVYHRGTGVAAQLTYIASIKDCYFYAEGNQAMYTQNATANAGFNLENVVLESNSATHSVFGRLDGGTFRMKNVSAIALNSSNTAPVFSIRVSGASELYMLDCTAIAANASAENIDIFDNSITTGGAYLYNTTMSKLGTGLDLNATPLLNQFTADSYGNIKIG